MYTKSNSRSSITIRTACSSSLIALHEACQALLTGQCAAAVVGGINLILAPHSAVALADQGVPSPTGICHTFSDDADGYARGEAVTAVYITKLSDAVKDKDAIRAVIRASSVNSDGHTSGIPMPNPKAQEELTRKCYQLAGITDPCSCLLYTSPSPRDGLLSRMPSSA